MKIAISSPYGSLSQEVGAIYLLANYLHRTISDITQLQCNGVFSICDRDSENHWRRSLQSCSNCKKDQRSLASWSSIETTELSRYLFPEDVKLTKQWITRLDDNDLESVEIDSINIFDLCKATIQNRFGLPNINKSNKQHLQFTKRLMLASARMLIASKRYIGEQLPDLILVAGGKDFITASLISQAKKLDRPVSVFEWNVRDRAIRINHPYSDEVVSCELLLEGLVSMRPDSKTWPVELLSIVREIIAFLNIPEDQLVLPLAR